jgi:hypothetical protein
MDGQSKCAHEPCTCPPREGSKYCSDYCETAGETTHIKCDCGHPACQVVRAPGPVVRS